MTLEQHLDSDGHLVGHSTEAALRAISHPSVLHSFTLESVAFNEGHIDSDRYDTHTVATAHAIRVAVAERWARAGASDTERDRAMTRARALDPYRDAILMHPEAEYISDWLGDLWVGSDVDVDSKSWWGFQLLDDHEFKEALDRTLKEISAKHLMPPKAPRHEHAWEAPPAGFDVPPWPYHEDWHPRPYHEVAHDRFEADFDMYADLAWDRYDRWLDERGYDDCPGDLPGTSPVTCPVT